jgi:hypothetical protein
LQDPSQTNGDILNNVRCETSRTFRDKKREYLYVQINELETNGRNKNIRENEFRNGYKHRTNSVKDENGDLLADSYNILNR